MRLRGPALVAALATAACLAGCGDAQLQRPPEGADEAGASSWDSLGPGWTALAPPPFSRSDAVSVWADDALLLWGGNTDLESVHHADGAVFDPLVGAWRTLPPSPLAGRSNAAAVWTGDELLVWGGWLGDRASGDGAAFERKNGSWRMLAPSPLEPRVPAAAAWTGRELIVWGDASRAGAAADGAAYDPARDTWRELPAAPLGLNLATTVWTGEEMIVYGALLDGNNHSATEHAQGIAYDPDSNEWRVLPPFPLSPQASTAVWTGSELIVWDYELRAAVYDPTVDRWSALPDLPLRFSECYPEGVQAGENVVFAWHCGTAALFDVDSRTWQALPGRAREIYGRPVAADGVFLFAGAAHEGPGGALWAYKPEEAVVFVPPTEQRGRVALPVTFPDGTSAVLTYPDEIDLAGMGIQPDVSYLYRDNRAPRFPLAFYRGEVPKTALGGSGPVDLLPTRAESPAELWEAPPTARDDGTPRALLLYRVVSRFGSWSVVAYVGDRHDAEVVASSLVGRETPDGFIALEAFSPIALSDESGEGEGSRVTIGDVEPDPDLARFDKRFRHLQVSLERCTDDHDELSPSGRYAHLCLAGTLTAQIYGDPAFVSAVFEGLGVRDLHLDDPAP